MAIYNEKIDPNEDTTPTYTCEDIYKVDSKGKVRVLKIQAKGDKLIQASGLLDGNLVFNEKTCKGKNLGRSNETTPHEQAVAEAKAKRTKKLKEGYFTSLEEAKNTKVIMPMLAKDYKKENKKIDWANDKIFVQPKLDGIRCLAFPGEQKRTLISRANRPIDTCDHISDVIASLDFPYPIDGELYIHGESFQEITRLVKKYRPGQTEKIEYHIYDVLVEDKSFEERIDLLTQVYTKLHSYPEIVLVPTYRVSLKIVLEARHSHWVSEGYEGTMVRWGDKGYKINGRCDSLLKYKDFMDMKVRIINVVPMEARPDRAMLVCEMSNGTRFKATPKCTTENKQKILRERAKYMDTTVEVRYFELTDDGVPRFPVALVELD